MSIHLTLFLILSLVVVLGMTVDAVIKAHLHKRYPDLWSSLRFPANSPFTLISAQQESAANTALFRYLEFLRSNARKELKDAYLDRLVLLYFALVLLAVLLLGLATLVLFKPA